MSEKVRIGVIGTGQIGTGHLKTYQVIPEAEVVAVCDIREDVARDVADQFGVPDVYTDYAQMLARDDIQSVDVCLHNQLHRPVAVDALRAGKNVYCEKPMSWTYGEAKVMYDAAQETGQMLHIQLGRIYRPTTVAAKRLIDGGHLGDIYAVRSVHYRRRGRPWVDGYGSQAFVSAETAGGGALIDYGVYNISRVLYLLGNPAVETVSGVAAQKLAMYEDRAEAAGYNVEEYAMAFLRLAGGINWSLEEAWAVHADSPEEIRLMGTQGGIRVEPLSYHTTLADMEMDATFDVERALWRWNQQDPTMKHVFNSDLPFHQNSQRHWVSAQLGLVELLPTAAIALQTVLVSDGIYLSSALGREVTADEIAAAEPGAGRPIPR